MSPSNQKQAEAVAAQWLQLCPLVLNETITLSITHSIAPTAPGSESSKEMTVHLGSRVFLEKGEETPK